MVIPRLILPCSGLACHTGTSEEKDEGMIRDLGSHRRPAPGTRSRRIVGRVGLAFARAVFLSAMLCGCGLPEDPTTASKADREKARRAKRPQHPHAQTAVALRDVVGPGRWAKLAPEADTADPELRAELEQLERIGYLQGSRRQTRSGVTVHDPRHIAAGLNLYASGHAPEAILMDASGDVLHRWRIAWSDLWDPLPWADPNTEWFRRVHLFPNGDLLAVFEGLGLVKLDRDSQVIWARPIPAHHDFEVLPDGDIAVLTRVAHRIPRVHPEKAILEDFITTLDSDGNELRSFSLLAALEASPHAEVMARGKRAFGDIFHTNTLSLLSGSAPAASPEFSAGRFLVSMNALGLVAVVDSEEGEIVWAHRGPATGQHDPRLLANGRVLLFQNRENTGASRVVEIDPVSGAVMWEYRGTPERPFYSQYLGTAQRLPGGNTLVTESDGGRAFEIDAEGRTVWEFYNPHRAGASGEFIATLAEVIRLPADFPRDWLGETPRAR